MQSDMSFSTVAEELHAFAGEYDEQQQALAQDEMYRDLRASGDTHGEAMNTINGEALMARFLKGMNRAEIPEVSDVTGQALIRRFSL